MESYTTAKLLFSSTDRTLLYKRNLFLHVARPNFTLFDHKLSCDILYQWESSPVLKSCFDIWKSYKTIDISFPPNSFHILSFNVRDLTLRYQEVLLLSTSFTFAY